MLAFFPNLGGWLIATAVIFILAFIVLGPFIAANDDGVNDDEKHSGLFALFFWVIVAVAFIFSGMQGLFS